MVGTVLSLFLALSSGGTFVSKGGINDDPVVGRFSIFAFYGSAKGEEAEAENEDASKGQITGHCFVQFKNTSGSSITIGHVNIGNNQYVTIGTWPGLAPYYDQGIWYNRESYDMAGWSTLGNYTLTTDITETGLIGLSSILTNSSYDDWFINGPFSYYTCATFAVIAWNAVNTVSSWALSTPTAGLPSDVKSQIGSKTGHGTNTSFATNSWCGYVSGGSYHAYP